MEQVTLQPFHLAIAVTDLEAARGFYRDQLGCGEGRSADRWVDFDLFGHQLVCHLGDGPPPAVSNAVDGDAVPVPHFGVILSMQHWQTLAQRLRDCRVNFVIEPRIRFAGEAGEQATMFLRDPAGNALEFKAFADPDQLFARG
jgi:extradiol dioxygenase family protein